MAPPVYTDMNILQSSNLKLVDVVELGTELGFEQFAINYVAPSLQGGKGKKNEKLVIPPPTEILLNDESIKDMKKRCKLWNQLSRFTAVLEDASNTHRLGAHDVQAYDIIAVQATSEKTFQLACSTLEVDIICLNLSESLGFTLKRPMVKMAAKRGIHFEICYSPALQDNSVKRNIICNAMSLVRSGGGKNIILSSGSAQPLDLRSPYDVINLAKLFGLSHSQAKNSVCGNCRAVLKHAETRKTCKSVISVIKSSKLSFKEQWVLQHNSTVNKERTHTDSSEADSNDEDESDVVDGNPSVSKLALGSEAETCDTPEGPERKKIKL